MFTQSGGVKMQSGINLNTASLYNTSLFQKRKEHAEAQDNNNITSTTNSWQQGNGEELLFNSLQGIARNNGYQTSPINQTNNSQAANTEQIADMLEAGNKQEVKDQMGAKAVPALMSIVQDTSKPMNVRVDAIATLAKLVDEGKAPASCLVQLLKDPNCKDMAERALANVGKEAMPAVKQLLNSGDPQLKESAKNILNDMKDAWAGYENDPKWGQECQQLLPEVDELLNKVENKDNKNQNQNNINNTFEQDDPDNPINFAGYNRQFINFSNMTA